MVGVCRGRGTVLNGVFKGDCLHGLPIATATRREGGTAVWLANLCC